MTGFVEAVNTVLTSQVTKYLVLGDKEHGEKSLKCLAAAVKAGDLKPLNQYHVTTVLFEGARKGQEHIASHSGYSTAVKILSKNSVLVLGCEDDESLSTLSEMDKLYLNPGSDGVVFQQKQNSLLSKRMPDANNSWLKQASNLRPKVIVCVGTSHLPEYTHTTHKNIGLVKLLEQHGVCYGFAVEKSNTNDPYWYRPEKGSGLFGKVESIDEYPDWNKV